MKRIKRLVEDLETALNEANSINEWNDGEWSADNRVWWANDEDGNLMVVTKYFNQYRNPMGCSYSFSPRKNETKAQCIKIINAYKKAVGLPPYHCDHSITYNELEREGIYI